MQQLASPQVGSPPFLKAKGPDVPFWCGGPLTFEPPPAPEGYKLEYGVGLWLYSRYNCSRSDCECLSAWHIGGCCCLCCCLLRPPR